MADAPRPRDRLLDPVDQGAPRRADDGTVVEERTAPHPAGTEVDPQRLARGARRRPAACSPAPPPWPSAASSTAWSRWTTPASRPPRAALERRALRRAPRPSSSRSRAAPQACAELTGSVLVASFTVTKLRWLRDHEPDARRRVRRVLLPHDYLTWHLGGRGDDAHHRPRRRLGHRLLLHPRRRLAARPARARPRARARLPAGRRGRPRWSAAHERRRGRPRHRRQHGRRAGPRPAAPGDVAVSIGTSGVASVVDRTPDRRRHRRGLRLRRRDRRASCRWPARSTPPGSWSSAPGCSGVDHDGLADAGAGSAPRRPRADPAALPGRRAHPQPTRRRRHPARTDHRPPPAPTWPGPPSRACCSAWPTRSTRWPRSPGRGGRLLLIGGGGPQPRRARAGPAVFGRPVVLPDPAEYVALGAARQAAWALSGRGRAADLAGARPPHLRRPDHPDLRERLRRAARPHRRLDPLRSPEGPAMTDLTPTPGQVLLRSLDRRSYQGRDPFGEPTRAPMDPVRALREAGRDRRLRRQLPRRRRDPVRRRRRRARADHRRFTQGAGRHRPGGHHRDDEPVHPPGVQGRRLHLQRPRRAPLRDHAR